MKKLISLFIAILTLFVSTLPFVSALFDSGAVTSKLNSQIYYMENLDQGTVFFDKESEKQVPLAGFAKVLVACVALEKWGNLDGEIKITEKHLNVFESIYGMALALYQEGETVTKKELFDCLVIASANDALSIITYDVTGTAEKMVQEMQSVINKAGCTSTSVKNIHGFDEEGQYTTARDVAKILKYATTFPELSEALGKEEITLKETELNDERTYYATNEMRNASVEDYYHSSVVAGKHTSTDLAGECIATVSKADGYSYLTVVMGGRYDDIDSDGYDENTSMTDTQLMLDWVYENIRFKVVASPEQILATVPVVAGKGTDQLQLVPEKEISALVPGAVTPASVMFEFVEGHAPEKIIAPVKSGEVLTQANVYYAGQKLTTINVVAKEDVELSFGGLVVTGIKTVIGSVIFLILAFLAAAIAVLKLVLDVKDFFDEERKKSFDPLPSSFEVLTEKLKKAVIFGNDKKKKGAAKGRPVGAKKKKAASPTNKTVKRTPSDRQKTAQTRKPQASEGRQKSPNETKSKKAVVQKKNNRKK